MDDFSPGECYIAHPDVEHGHHQSVYARLNAVSELAGRLAEKLGFAEQGRLIGLMHDVGKYRSAFQNYMRIIIAEQARYNPDNYERSNFSAKDMFNE